MKNFSEYDLRQLKLMQENLTSFENKQIELSSLVGSLEFLLNALESASESWEEQFLKEITTLETINALEIIKAPNEEVNEIEEVRKSMLISESIQNLKNLFIIN